MKEKKLKKFFSSVAWLLVCGLIIIELGRIFTPKWMDDLAPTRTIDGFYAEEENSLDVIFFGTSQSLYGFSPMQLYEDTGIRSYVCATGSQSIICTYYWICEALKYQTPKLIVVETMGAIDESVLGDGALHCALDYMRFSTDKIKAVMEVDKYYNFETTPLEYFVPILKYHDRWKELKLEDFTYRFSDKKYFLKGYRAGNSIYADTKATGIKVKDKSNILQMQDYQTEYLQKIIILCRQKNIELLFTKTALPCYSEKSHNAIEKIANENAVPFLDYNIRNVWQDAGLNYLTDFADLPHLNINGAQKTTRYMGDYLLKNYPELKATVSNKTVDARWENDLRVYKEYLIPQKEKLEENIEFWKAVHADDEQ